MLMITLGLCLLLAQILTSAWANSFTTGMESNEIPQSHPDIYKPLSITCRGPSECALLQANARGINVQPFCRCPGAHKCPMTWDSRDDHSITQGSNQHKFCHRVSDDVGRCSQAEIAYTTVWEYKTTGENEFMTYEKKFYSGHVHCYCPDHHIYELYDVQEENADGSVTEIYTFTCQKMKTCGPSDSCRQVTETSSSFMVGEVCTCPHGLTCPSHPRAAYDTVQLGRGIIYKIRCQ